MKKLILFMICLMPLLASNSFGGPGEFADFNDVFNTWLGSNIFKLLGLGAIITGFMLYLMTHQIHTLVFSIVFAGGLQVFPAMLLSDETENFEETTVQVEKEETYKEKKRFDNLKTKKASQDINIENYGTSNLEVNYNTFNGPVTIIYEKDGGQRIIEDKKETKINTNDLKNGKTISTTYIPTNRQLETPILLEIDKNIVKNKEVEKCFVLGQAHGNIHEERVSISLSKLSCKTKTNNFTEDIKGQVFDLDGKLGVKGELVSKSSEKLRKALLTSTLSSVAEIIDSESPISNNISKLAQYYIDSAEYMYPTIKLKDNRNVLINITNEKNGYCPPEYTYNNYKNTCEKTIN